MADPVQLGTYAEKLRGLEERLGRLESEGGGNGPGDGIELRLVRLEAQMEAARAELAKLAPMPADIAGIKERLNHLPTRFDVKADIDPAVDRAGTRTQRNIAIVGVIVGAAVAALNYMPHLH